MHLKVFKGDKTGDIHTTTTRSTPHQRTQNSYKTQQWARHLFFPASSCFISFSLAATGFSPTQPVASGNSSKNPLVYQPCTCNSSTTTVSSCSIELTLARQTYRYLMADAATILEILHSRSTALLIQLNTTSKPIHFALFLCNLIFGALQGLYFLTAVCSKPVDSTMEKKRSEVSCLVTIPAVIGKNLMGLEQEDGTLLIIFYLAVDKL